MSLLEGIAFAVTLLFMLIVAAEIGYLLEDKWHCVPSGWRSKRNNAPG